MFIDQKYRHLRGRFSMIKRITKLAFAIISGVAVAAVAAQALHLAA
jgi:TRAP-type C4-dicarboxylate transport system permease large subunit